MKLLRIVTELLHKTADPSLNVTVSLQIATVLLCTAVGLLQKTIDLSSNNTVPLHIDA